MSFRNMEFGSRFKRVKHMVQAKTSKEDEEIHNHKVNGVITRNSKVSQFVTAYRKTLAANLLTGLKEENVDKRKKKCFEQELARELRETSVELQYLSTSCLHHTLNGFGTLLYNEVDERVKLEMAIERRVYDELAPFLDYDKQSGKLKSQLKDLGTDQEIALKNYEKEPNNQTYKDELDLLQSKYDSLKDTMLTDVFTSSVPKELMINQCFLTNMNLRRDYFKKMFEMYDNAVPMLESMMANAVTRPVFGVALEAHLSTQRGKIATTLTKTCEFLREHAMLEKGIFRINGNMGKVKRICAALDAGEFDNDKIYYHNDPHSVASVLKAYLRELPDPLTQDSMKESWVEALNKKDEEKFVALQACIQKMSPGHRDNLIYLIRFLYDVEAYRDINHMNAANLAIVFAPTVTGMVYDGMNSYGVKLIEYLISNAARLFNFPPQETPLLPGCRNSPPTIEATPDVSPPSTFTRAQLSISPRSFRPKEKAPPPPVDVPGTSASTSTSTNRNLMEFTDDDDFSDDTEPFTSNGSSLVRSSTEHRPNRPPPPAFRSNPAETPKSRPISYNIAVGARPSESAPPKPMTASLENVLSETPIAPERKRLSVMSIGGLSRVGPNANQSSSQESSSGSLVTDGGDNRTLVSLDGEPSTSQPSSSATTSSAVPSNVQPPPQSAKPKPPLPVKPKDLSNESSRL